MNEKYYFVYSESKNHLIIAQHTPIVVSLADTLITVDGYVNKCSTLKMMQQMNKDMTVEERF